MRCKLSYTGEKIDDLLMKVDTGSVVTELTDDFVDPSSEYPVSGIAVGALHLTLLATEGDTEGGITFTDDDSRHNRAHLGLFWERIEKGRWNDNTPVFLAVRSKEGSSLLSGKINIASSYGINLGDKTSRLARFWFALPINGTLEAKRVLNIYFIVDGTTIRAQSRINDLITVEALNGTIVNVEIAKYREELMAIEEEREIYREKYSAMEKLSGEWVAYSGACLQFKLYLQEVIAGTADIDSRYTEYRNAYYLAKAALDGYSVLYSEKFKDLPLEDCPTPLKSVYTLATDINFRTNKEFWKIEKEKIANEQRQLRAEYYIPNASQNGAWSAYNNAWGQYNSDLAFSITTGSAAATLSSSKANYESAKSDLSTLPKNSDYIINIVEVLRSSGIIVPAPISTE